MIAERSHQRIRRQEPTSPDAVTEAIETTTTDGTTTPASSDATNVTTTSSDGTNGVPVTTGSTEITDSESPDTTTARKNASPFGKTPPMSSQPDTKAVQLIHILVGTLVAMFVLSVVMCVVIVAMVIWGCKVARHRREQRELVLRTKHVIFEGISNAISTENIVGNPMHTPMHNPMHKVLDSSPTLERNVTLESCVEQNVDLELTTTVDSEESTAVFKV